MISLREKLEGALKVYLEQTIKSGVFTGLGDFEVTYPAVVCSYLGGEDIHPQSNHVSAEMLVTVISSSDGETVEDSTVKHNDLVGLVVSAFESDDLAGNLMAAGDALIVNGIESTSEEQPDVESDDDGKPIFKSGYSVRLMAGHN